MSRPIAFFPLAMWLSLYPFILDFFFVPRGVILTYSRHYCFILRTRSVSLQFRSHQKLPNFNIACRFFRDEPCYDSVFYLVLFYANCGKMCCRSDNSISKACSIFRMVERRQASPFSTRTIVSGLIPAFRANSALLSIRDSRATRSLLAGVASILFTLQLILLFRTLNKLARSCHTLGDCQKNSQDGSGDCVFIRKNGGVCESMER